MNQHSFQAISAMVNSFPNQSAAEKRALLLTFEVGLGGVPEVAISETARRFLADEIPGRNPAFPPSVAEFVQAARRVPISRPSLPSPEPERQMDHAAKARMRLKMPLYRHAQECGLMDDLDRANRAGVRAMMTLAERWGVPVPELLDMPEAEAERQWEVARSHAWADIRRNPPPFMRRMGRG